MGKLLLAGLTIAVSVLLAADDVRATVAWNETISGEPSGRTAMPTSLGTSAPACIRSSSPRAATTLTCYLPHSRRARLQAITASEYARHR